MPSVLSCTLQRVQPPSSTDDLNRYTYQLKYDVVTDAVMSHKALANAAMSASPHPLPNYGTTFSYLGDTDSTAYAQPYSVEPKFGDQSQTQYVITVTFKPLPDSDVTVFEPNPFFRDPVVWVDREVFTRFIERDVLDKAIVNKCGRPYDTPVEQEDVRSVIVVEFNVSAISTAFAYMRFLRRAVNVSPWSFRSVVFPARSVLAREVAASPPITQGAFTYYRMFFRFVVAEGDGTLSPTAAPTWDTPILERGYKYFELDFGGGMKMGPDGQKALFPPEGEVEPVLLAEDGTKLPDGQLGIFTPWRTYREVNFNLLPFS